MNTGNDTIKNRDEWLARRRRGIGGSDVAPILGLSPWRTPLQVYMEKRGELPGQDETEAMKFGKLLEPIIRQEYSNLTGKMVVVPSEILVHPKHSFALANLDGAVPGERVVEIKASRNGFDFGEPGTDEIPEYYLTQVAWYMAIADLPLCDVAVLFGGQKMAIYTVGRDMELEEVLLEKMAEFWNRVLNADPPDPEGYQDMVLRFGRHSKEQRVQADADTIEAVRALKALKADAKGEEDLKARIMARLGEADTLCDGDEVLCTWKLSKGSKRFDAKAFAAAHPALYEEFKVEGRPGRRFLLK